MRWFRPAIIAPVLCLIYMLTIALQAGHPYIWVTPAEKRAPEDLLPYAYSPWGYDGFYVYLIARDPVTAPQFVDTDAAPYRFQRVLLPALARFFAFWQMDWLPYSLMILNLLSLGLGTWALEELLKMHGFNAWYAIGYAFSLAAFGAARLSMTETMAYGLALLGILFMQRKQWLGGAILFALAALAKETTLFLPAAYGFWMLYKQEWKQAIGFGLITLLPIFLWEVAIYLVFGEIGLGSGGSTDSGFYLMPFGAVIEMLGASSIAGIILFAIILIPPVILPFFWSLWQCVQDFRQKEWTIFSQLLAFNIAILPFTPFSTFSEPIAIFRFIAGMQIALILYAASKRKLRALRYSSLWLFTGLLIISSDLAYLGGNG